MEGRAEGIRAVGKDTRGRRHAADVPIWKSALIYAVCFIAFTVLWRAKTGPLSPFATGLYPALVCSGLSALILLPLYVLSAFIVNPDFDALISAVITAVVISAVAVLCGKLKKRQSLGVMLPAVAVGQTGYIYFSVISGVPALYTALNPVFSLIFAYVSTCALKPVLPSFTLRRPPDTELASAGIVLSVLAAGFASMEFYRVKILYVFGMLVIALISFLMGRGPALAAAVCVGLGAALFSFNVTGFALFAFVTAVFVMFSGAVRILSVLAAVMATVLFELYFDVDSSALLYDIIAISAGGVIYAALPYKWLLRLKNYFFEPHGKLAVRHLIGSGREELAAEVKKVSSIFGDMSRSLRLGERSDAYSAAEIFNRLKEGICAGCGRCADCSDEADNALRELCDTAVEKGRASVSDIPFLVENDCPNAARLLSVSGEYADFMKKRADEAGKGNRIREDLAQQLDGVADILNETVRRISSFDCYDSDKEALLTEELCYRGIAAADALISKGERDRVTVIVGKNESDSETISSVAASVLCGEYSVESVKPCASSAYDVVTLKEKTDFDAVFGAASASKSQTATGDTHSFIKISDTKFMMALCDGMGSGSEAGRISETAIDLVESFFRAGFDSDFILKNVNRFLSYDSGESFAAFDILVCDLNTLERSIIKLGSPASYIHGGDGVMRVEGSALPLGALKEIKPCVYSDKADDGQTVIFVSDGISDLFEGDSLAQYVSTLSSLNVKSLCEQILDRAKQLAGGETRDDMTVTAARLLRRV